MADKKILVIADNHGDMQSMVDVLDLEHDADLVIHLGDSEFSEEKISSMVDIYVPGNRDLPFETETHKTLDFAGVRLVITHGDKEMGFSYKLNHAKIADLLDEEEADIFMHGHTHLEELISLKDNKYILCPGSIAQPRNSSGLPTYALITINEENGEFNIELNAF